MKILSDFCMQCDTVDKIVSVDKIVYIHLEDPRILISCVRNVLLTFKLDGRKKTKWFWARQLYVSAVRGGAPRTDRKMNNTCQKPFQSPLPHR